MAVVHFFGEKIALLVMRMLRSSLSSSRSIHSRASSHSLIVVIDVGFLTLLMARSFPTGACWVSRFRISPSTWKTAAGFSGKPTPPWPAGKTRLRCRGAVLRALFRRGGVGRWGGLVRICSASAVGALGPQHLGGVFFVENLVAVAAFKCLLDHGGLLFRRGMRFGRAAVCASCPLHGKR